MPTLSTKGSEIIVPNSGHHIQLDAPDAVVDAIRRLVLRAR
jgi:pimeloyl-ACP methyl ester carboxylesterase